MSPEHTTRTRRPVDSRSDLYSLGMVLYELLTGRLPFELGADDQTNWAHYHIASEPLAPDVIRPDVPGMLSTILLKLLEKHPDNRYQTVDGLIADLRRCQATLTGEGEIAPLLPVSRIAPRRSIWRIPCSRRIRRRMTSLPRLSESGRAGCQSW